MEFLEPSEKKARTIRLFIGYALLAVVVGLTTTILVFQAQGFGYDRDKGVTRNGLLFIDAKPASAAITLDGTTLSDKTNARINLSEGVHTVKLNIDKYREWTKQFTIEGGEVKYLLYPRLFPKDIPLGVTRVLPQAPAWAKQSPDRHWLVYQQTTNSAVLAVADLLKPTDNPVITALPATVLPNENGNYGTLKPTEWSDDNKHLLLLQTLPSGATTYVMFNREKPDESQNITKALSLTADQQLTLRDKKFDKYYVFSPTKGELRNATIKTNTVSEPFLTGVVSFKSHGDDIVYYVTYVGAKDTEANLVVLVDQKNKFNLKPIPRETSGKYLLNLAKFDGDWFYVAGSNSNPLVRIYKNPLARVKANSTTQALPQVSLRIDNPQFVSFSDNTRFIAAQSGKQFVVFDAEDARVYRYEMQLNIAKEQQAVWMDGHRLVANSDGRIFVFDFDGANAQNLVSSIPALNAYFDRDYEFLYSFVQQADGKVAFQNARLVLQ